MAKIIVLVVVVWLVVMLMRRRLGPRGENRALRDVRTVRCAHCGLHLPEPDAIHGAGHDYCSAEHRKLGPREG